MFLQAPSDAFHPDISPLDRPNAFCMESTQVSSGEEDVSGLTDLSVKLADFGTGRSYAKTRMFDRFLWR